MARKHKTVDLMNTLILKICDDMNKINDLLDILDKTEMNQELVENVRQKLVDISMTVISLVDLDKPQ
jgi:hypothetical protein